MTRRLPVVGVLGATCAALACASPALGATPTLFGSENCSSATVGVRSYGATLGVTGFPPSTDVAFSLATQPINPDGTLTDGFGADGEVTTDANGDYTTTFGGVGAPAVITLTVTSPYLPGGSATVSVRATCEPKRAVVDLDSDDDGLSDRRETQVTHTDPHRFDTDGDGISDGVEVGNTQPVADPPGPALGTTLTRFRRDLDPRTRTSPLERDSDGDGRPDGLEDKNHNGRRDRGETSPVRRN